MDKMDNQVLEDVSGMEEEAKYRIITMEDEEESSSRSEKILSDCKTAVAQLYANFREWMKEYHDSEEVKERKEKLKQDSDKLIAAAKEQLKKLQENEELRSALNKGVQVASDTGTWVLGTLNDGFQEIKKSESGQKVSAVVHQIKEDERVKKGVSSFKKGTLKLAESALDGLKKVLDEESAETEVTDDETNHDI